MWARLYRKTQPPVEIVNTPKTTLNNALTECENAMEDATRPLGFYAGTLASEDAYKAKLIKEIEEKHQKELLAHDPSIQIGAIFNRRTVQTIITEIKNLHYVSHPEFKNFFVLTRKDQFESIINIFKLKKAMEELKNEINKAENITNIDFKNFIERSKTIVNQFKDIIRTGYANRSDSYGEPFIKSQRYIGQCETALSNANNQIATLFPQTRPCIVS